MSAGTHEMREKSRMDWVGVTARLRRHVLVSAIAGLMLTAAVAATAWGQSAPSSGGTAPRAPDQATSSSPAAAAPVAVGTPINGKIRVVDTVEARDQPSNDSDQVGRIQAGVLVDAVGLVAGGDWVQIKLPNGNIAYVPRTAMAVDASGKAVSETQKVEGTVTSVTNAATLVIGDRTVRLAGLDPGPASVLSGFETWVKSRGALECDPVAETGAYHCYTSAGVDVGEAAILNGAARVGDGATEVYREREATARDDKRGLWGLP
jgi:endonuclease YncB( thermonuclease family)